MKNLTHSAVNQIIDAYKLDQPQATKEGFWKQITAYLTFLYRERGDEMIADEVHAASMRKASKNRLAMNDDKSRRALGVLPARLEEYLSLMYPLWEATPYPNKQKFYLEFYKRFPQFSYAEKL